MTLATAHNFGVHLRFGKTSPGEALGPVSECRVTHPQQVTPGCCCLSYSGVPAAHLFLIPFPKFAAFFNEAGFRTRRPY